MRLWHYKLIPLLPNSQLLAQWRELNSILKNQPKHILINYVYEYSKEDLWVYCNLVLDEMARRKFRDPNLDNFRWYFFGLNHPETELTEPFRNHHNNRYLLQNFYNLQEKYDRGQKDFDTNRYETMEELIKNEIH